MKIKLVLFDIFMYLYAMINKIDLTGNRYGKLLVLSLGYTKKQRFWLCKCDCGKEVYKTTSTLNSGGKSCGCFWLENRKVAGFKHGLVKTSEYCSWAQMKNRCLNANDKRYKDYGGRGITVCERWNDFQLFLEDMGKKPESGMSIERLDNNKGYNPENCIWATNKTQSRNKRNTVKITFEGVEKSISEWAEITGIAYHVLSSRLKNNYLGNIFDPVQDAKYKQGYEKIHFPNTKRNTNAVMQG